MQPPRILSIAGSDPSGGAGIQADLKTIAALGGYGMAAITALTAQNTTGVYGVHAVPAAFVVQQMRLCLEDIGANAIKTGMLFSAEIVEAVAGVLPQNIPLILDPVMVAKGGAALLNPDAIAAVKTRLIPRAHLITPNIPEAELLCGIRIETPAHMQQAGEALLAMGAGAALIKGGHMQGDSLTDLLVMPTGSHAFQSARLPTRHTHGTGCTLASAIATRVGAGDALPQAVTTARAYVLAAIQAAPGFGTGHGPLWHGVTNF
jgi:hydroxymethylpyrimidine/phosphomethylpyrimidine kinase